MASHTVSRTIAAPLEKVFGVVTVIEANPDVFPSVTKIEFIGEQRSDVGTRFAETRFESGRDGTSDVEAEPHKLATRLTMALGMSGYRANMEKHVDAIKEHCETLT